MAVALAPGPNPDSLPSETPIQGQCCSYATMNDRAARRSPFCIVGMGRLTTLKSRIGKLPPRLGPMPGDEQERNRNRQTAEPWRKWYQLAEWKRLRIQTFTRDHFTCQMAGCGRIEGDTSKLICDHITPHKGDRDLFFDAQNLQTLCKPCHDTVKQREERSRGRW